MPRDDIKGLLDDAEAHLKKAVRPREKTITDGVLGPAEGNTPKPPPPRPRAKPPLPEPLPAVIRKWADLDRGMETSLS